MRLLSHCLSGSLHNNFFIKIIPHTKITNKNIHYTTHKITNKNIHFTETCIVYYYHNSSKIMGEIYKALILKIIKKAIIIRFHFRSL